MYILIRDILCNNLWVVDSNSVKKTNLLQTLSLPSIDITKFHFFFYSIWVIPKQYLPFDL